MLFDLGRDFVHLCLLRQRPDPFRGGPRGDAGSKSAPAKETPHRKSDAQRRGARRVSPPAGLWRPGFQRRPTF